MAGDYEAVLEAALQREIGDPPREEDYRGDFRGFDRALIAWLVDKRRTARKLSRRLPRTPLNQIGKEY